MCAEYIENHFDAIIKYKNIIEKRPYDTIDKSELIQDNTRNLQLCKKYNLPYILIDKVYDTNIEL